MNILDEMLDEYDRFNNRRPPMKKVIVEMDDATFADLQSRLMGVRFAARRKLAEAFTAAVVDLQKGVRIYKRGSNEDPASVGSHIR